MKYNRYFVEGCEQKDISRSFIRILLACSDAFSLIYFRYKENEKQKKSTLKIKKKFAPYKLCSKEVTEWPGTKLYGNEQGHIYQMETYSIDMAMLPVFDSVDTIWDWDYPQFPMDPCFYRNGYAWFSISTHEHDNSLYLREDESVPSVLDLESFGLKLIPQGEVKESELFYNDCFRKST